MVWFTLPSFRWLGFWGEVWVLFEGRRGDWRVVDSREGVLEIGIGKLEGDN